MLKTTILLEILTSKLLKVDDNEVNRVCISSFKKIAKKSGKSKNKKLSKFQKSAKSGKKLLKSINSHIFGIKKNGLSFLTSKTKVSFNCLWLAFIKVLIFDILIRNATFRSKLMHQAMPLEIC